jgi:inosine-uridine nucleoside N-ribohydrolase
MKQLITLLFTLLLSTYTNCQTVWLDADTGNEMDDLYAIARLVKEPGLKIAGLSSAHFNNPDLLVFEKWNAYDSKGLNTVDESQKLNEQILKSLGRSEIPHPKGADRQIGRAWGGRDPRDSPAARSIIEAVSSLPEGQKLDIITIGAVTNVVSAIIIAPEIISKIRCFTLGASYKPETGVWNKNEFNVRNDLNAFDYLLDCVGLDLTIMPLEAALPMQFDRDETYKKLNDKTGIQLILKERWIEHNPQDKTRIMWDLALVEAYLNPSLAKTATVNNPPENRQRAIKVYTGIDEKNLADDFWNTLKNK